MRAKDENTLRIELKRTVDPSYDLMLNIDFPDVAADLKKRSETEKKFKGRYAIITDFNVGPLYAAELRSELSKCGIDAKVFTFGAGEEFKRWETAGMLLNQMAAAGYGKDTIIIALGGGVVGDTAGFSASVMRRGVAYAGVPTSTLAMADSAIGGKTAVDLDAGKNLAGRIEQPSAVYFIRRTLETLDPRHYRSGIGEVVKHGVIRDDELFCYLEKNAHLVLNQDADALNYIARKNCWIKGQVVEKDPDEELGLRKILNFGHTPGHAIETLSGYQLTHGESVAIGMMVSGRVAVMMGTGLTYDDVDRIGAALQQYGLPITVPRDMPDEDIVKKMFVDKKVRGGKLMFCLPSGIGTMHPFGERYVTPVSEKIVLAALGNSR